MTGTLIAILAAGSSARMRGGDKIVEPVGGRPLLRVLAERALSLGPEVAVTLPLDRPARAAAIDGLAVARVTVPDAATGMAASFRAVAGLARGRAVLVVLGDMPEIGSADMAAILDRAATAPDRITRATAADGTPGQPVWFPAAIVPEMATLAGDEGARGLMAGRAVTFCPLPGRRALTDLDTPEAWAAWRAR